MYCKYFLPPQSRDSYPSTPLLLLRHSISQLGGNLQAARVAANPLPHFMYSYAARRAAAAIQAALPVSLFRLMPLLRNVGGIVS